MDDVLQHMDAVLPGYGTVQLHVPGVCVPPGQAVANSYAVHSSAPERRFKNRVVCVSCSKEVAIHAKLRREAVSCHGQIAAPRVTARRGDPIHFFACRSACRDQRDKVNTCNLERRLEVTSSSLATMQSLIAWVPSWTETSSVSSTPEE